MENWCRGSSPIMDVVSTAFGKRALARRPMGRPQRPGRVPGLAARRRNFPGNYYDRESPGYRSLNCCFRGLRRRSIVSIARRNAGRAARPCSDGCITLARGNGREAGAKTVGGTCLPAHGDVMSRLKRSRSEEDLGTELDSGYRVADIQKSSIDIRRCGLPGILP